MKQDTLRHKLENKKKSRQNLTLQLVPVIVEKIMNAGCTGKHKSRNIKLHRGESHTMAMQKEKIGKVKR